MRYLLQFVVAGLFVLVGPSLGAEPHAVRVGDPSVSGTSLQPYDNAWVYSARLPDGSVRVQGIWTDHFARTTSNGKPAWRRLQGMTYANHTMSSVSNVFDAATCAPFENEQHHPDESVLIRKFDGMHVTTDRLDRQGSEAKRGNFDGPQAVFDFFGGTYGLLLSCLPLKVGYQATIPAIDETKDVFKPVTVSVLREETVLAGRLGMVRTLVAFVDVPDEYSQTFWLSKAPPYIIKLQVAWADKHATATFDML